MNYKNRDEEVRATISKDEAIRLIEQIYHARYDSDNLTFDVYDQLLACESVVKSTPIKKQYNYQDKERTNENVSVNGNGNDSYKQSAKFEITNEKLQIISELKACKYTTPPPVVASLLDNFFKEWPPNKKDHWLFIVQKYQVRSINHFINIMIKQQKSGFKTILNPAAYLTNLIKRFGAKRKDKFQPPMIADNKVL